MSGKDAPPEVKIRSYQDSPICDVVVVVHGTEMVLRCPDYRQAMRWARLERKKYKFLSPISTLQPKLNPATCHFSCVEMEIDLCSARNVRKTGGEDEGKWAKLPLYEKAAAGGAVLIRTLPPLKAWR